MKICLITNLYQPYVIGGAEIYAEQIASELSKKHEVVVITTRPFNGLSSISGDVEEKGGVRIYRFFPLNVYHTYNAKNTPEFAKPLWHLIDLWNIHSYLAVKKILEKEKPDVVHTHNLGGLSASVLYAAKNQGIPVVHTLHDCSLLCPRATLMKGCIEACGKPNILCTLRSEIKKRTLAGIGVVISPSHFLLDQHLKNGFFKASKNKILPLGVNIITEKTPQSKDTFDLLYIGHLIKQKGVSVLIKAIKGIGDENIRLHIAGTGPDENYFKELALDDKRIIFHGFVSGASKNDLLSTADVMVLPSLCFENAPLTICESFSYGIPVIASRIGGIPELVIDGVNGFLFSPGDESALQERISGLINNNPEVKRISGGARASFKKYSISDHVNSLEVIYHESSGK